MASFEINPAFFAKPIQYPRVTRQAQNAPVAKPAMREALSIADRLTKLAKSWEKSGLGGFIEELRDVDLEDIESEVTTGLLKHAATALITQVPTPTASAVGLLTSLLDD